MPSKTKHKNTIDEQIEETFPASDPPSFMGGEVLGAPKGHETVKPAKREPVGKIKKASAVKRPAVKARIKKAKRTKAATKRRNAR